MLNGLDVTIRDELLNMLESALLTQFTVPRIKMAKYIHNWDLIKVAHDKWLNRINDWGVDEEEEA